MLYLTNSFHSSISNFVKRISNAERLKFKLNSYLKQILIGNILGDIHMRRFSEKANVRIIFRQGYKNATYLFHLFSLFQEFVITPPSISVVSNKKKKKKNR